jgi:hypothetical protein
MSGQKCPNCGLTNWSDVPECKRCKAPQQPQEETYGFRPPQPIFEKEKPATALGILMVIWGALMLTGGVYLLTFNQASYILALGSATLISGVSVTRGRQSGMALYFLGIVVTVFWACSQGRVGLAIGTSL